MAQQPAATLDPDPPNGRTDGHVLVARQPILDRTQRVFGYELLFREAGADRCLDASERATARLITNAVLDFGLDALTRGGHAFINLTRGLLLSDVVLVLPPGRVVLELLEDIEADADVMAACRRLKQAGYAIALDDFALTDRNADLLDVADFVKLDFLSSRVDDDRRRILGRCKARPPLFVGEKIETLPQFDYAADQGFEYFQGFFFGQPVAAGTAHLDTHPLGYFRILRALHDPNLTIAELEDLVKHDAAICYWILRAANAASSGQRVCIDSIRQALVLIGIDVVRRWASLWILAGLGQAGHAELVVMSVVRARCCEIVGDASPRAQVPAAFLLGLCSLLDVMLHCPMKAILSHLDLPPEARDALLGADGPSRLVLECVIAYERGEWDRCFELAGQIDVDPALLAVAHREALSWAAELRR